MMPLDAYTVRTANGGKTRRRIFRMLASGLSMKQIAYNLRLSEKTIQYHWKYIKKMVGVDLPTQLPWIALKRRWATGTGKWIKAFMSLTLVTSVMAVDAPPALPKTYKSATGVTQGAGAAKLLTSIVVIQPKTFELSWCYPSGPGSDYAQGLISFNIYHSTSPGLSTMTLLANVQQQMTFTFSRLPEGMEFFAVKAMENSTNFESDWAIVGHCPY